MELDPHAKLSKAITSKAVSNYIYNYNAAYRLYILLVVRY